MQEQAITIFCLPMNTATQQQEAVWSDDSSHHPAAGAALPLPPSFCQNQ
jgi:hypothetical protein